jgi:ABC-type amino acid transport substrate-binding protein
MKKSTHKLMSYCLLFVMPMVLAAPMVIRTAAQDSQPKFIKQGGPIVGLCVDIFNAIERVDNDLKFSGLTEFTPLPRIEAYLEEGQMDAFCGLAKTEKRLVKLDFIDTPIYTTNSVLAARADEKADIKNLDDIRKLGSDALILTVTKTVQAEYLASQPGLLVDSTAKDTSTNLQKLISGRGRFIYHNDFALEDEIKRDNLSGKIKLLPAQIVTEGRYMVVSKRTSAALREKLRLAIEKLSKSGELAKLFEPYRPK